MAEPRLIRLDGDGTSLLIDTRGPGVPLVRHWGPALPAGIDLAALADIQARPVPNNALDEDVPPSLVPEIGFGAFGQPGLAGSRADGTAWATAFRLIDTECADGRATVRLEDAAAGLTLALMLEVDADTGVLASHAALTNTGDGPYRLDWCAAAVLPLPAECGEGLVFDGQWNREFHERRLDFGQGVVLRDNRRGRTSHDAFPGLIAGRPGFGEETGTVYGFHLGWSGNHRLLVETTVDGARAVQLGELPMPGEVILAPGESYRTPTAYAAFAETGLNALSDRFHRFVRGRLLRWPSGAMRPRPVHLNTWEAVYFDHRLEQLTALADRAAALGVERFVLDDGWFGLRDDDTTSLGDWTPDPRKYADGLDPLIGHVRELGMDFGLWVEPEMVNPDSALYRAHPDWALALDRHPRPTGRNQLVLDLCRTDVSNFLFDALDRLLRAHAIAYLKWDMNRDLAPAGSAGRAAYRRQTLALYALLDRLRAAHPTVEIESCASGGARVDFGILPHVQRFWPSDSNDPVERATIQRGFARFLPLETMGAHVGPSPGHTTGRRTSLDFRAAVALFGHFGLEMDVTRLDEDEATALAEWIERYKRLRPLLHGGRMVRADDPPEAARMTLGTVDAAGDEGLFAVLQMASSPYRIPPRLRLPGLDPGRDYRLRLAAPAPAGARLRTPALEALAADGLVLPGAALTSSGIQGPQLWPATALLLRAEAVKRRQRRTG
ncbi:MAG: alpha-galactosidase [Inquilinus sp.]|nr:alpha-galactosidase [Inquilinus sp.]